ncbi:crAss001_48 related protein [Intestinibacter sp.]|uniref:crAss001_48 related protein n=1 Tax=Intestinibacter sp. TaxID=1965304 RepID=UPI003F18AE13
MINEYKEWKGYNEILRERLTKLMEFLNSDKSKELDTEARAMLYCQHCAMMSTLQNGEQYLQILKDRCTKEGISVE